MHFLKILWFLISKKEIFFLEIIRKVIIHNYVLPYSVLTESYIVNTDIIYLLIFKYFGDYVGVVGDGG